MKWAKNFFKSLTAVAASASLLLASAVGMADAATPDDYRINAGTQLELQFPGITVKKQQENDISAASFMLPGQKQQAQLMLFGVVPVKTVDVLTVQETWVVPCGTSFGIKMFTDGVVIVGTADIQTDGKISNPATQAGLKTGDIILSIDGKQVDANEEVAEIIENSQGKTLEILAMRNEEPIKATLCPVKSDVDGSFKGGLWVRDSTAGIGTITFYDPNTDSFGGLGHGICDVDTGELMPLGSGEIVPVTISGIVKGQKGKAGELKGYFSSDLSIGTLSINGEAGVYGRLDSNPVSGVSAVQVAMRHEVSPGDAKIIATLDETGPKEYDIQIESVNYREDAVSKNLVIRVTDPELLSLTGGIVQGMSGSPIIQNGKLVGAVTHVFVNDPTRGYGIFAENMLQAMQTAVEE